MSGKSQIRFILLILSFVLLFSNQLPAENTPVEKFIPDLPDNTVAFCAGSGGEKLKSDFDKATIGKIWNDPGVQDFLCSVNNKLVQALKQEGGTPNPGEALNGVLNFLDIAVDKPFFAVVAEIQTEDGLGIYGFVVLKAETDKKKIRTAWAELEALLDEDELVDVNVKSHKMRGPDNQEQMPLFWGWVDDYFVLAVNDRKGLAVNYLESYRSRSSRLFKSLGNSRDLISLYVDWQRTTGFLKKLETKSRGDPQEMLSFLLNTFRGLGFNNIRCVSCEAGFEGLNIVSDSIVRTSGPVKLLTLFEPVELKAFEMVPANATTASAVNINIPGMYQMLLDTVKSSLPEQHLAEEMEESLQTFQQKVNFDIRKDLLNSLAGPAVFYTLPPGIQIEAPAGGGVVIAKLRDTESFEKSLQALAEFLTSKSQGMFQAGTQLQSDGRKYHTWVLAPLSMMQIMPTWTIVDDWVVCSSNPALSVLAVKQAAAPTGQSLADSRDFEKIQPELPGNLLSLDYRDSKVVFRQVMMQAQKFWPMLTMLTVKQGVQLPAVLPSLGHITQNMQPTWSYSWRDSTGIRSHYQGPGVDASVVAVAGTAIGMSVMMPALHKARSQAHIALSKSNLHQLGLCLRMYADDHEGKLPDNLKQLEPSYFENFAQIESPRKPKDFTGPGYMYVPLPTMNIKKANRFIVVYENPAYCDDKICALLADLSVRALKRNEFLHKLEQTYKYLGKQMPEIQFNTFRN